MGLIEQASFLSEIFGEFGYLAAFAVLLLCGLGLPLPEEVTLLTCGLLVYQAKVDFRLITLVCSVAILLGDSIPFWLGRRYGMSALNVRWVAKVLHPERFARLKLRFQEHGNWATFASRFFAGVRIPSYFLAGTMGMSYGRFCLLDGLGILLSVPLSIFLGMVFADSIDELEETMQDMHLILGFVALSLILILVLRYRRQNRLGMRAGDRSPSGAKNRSSGPRDDRKAG